MKTPWISRKQHERELSQLADQCVDLELDVARLRRERDRARAQASNLQKERLEREKLRDLWQHKVAACERVLQEVADMDIHNVNLITLRDRAQALLSGNDGQEPEKPELGGPVVRDADKVPGMFLLGESPPIEEHCTCPPGWQHRTPDCPFSTGSHTPRQRYG